MKKIAIFSDIHGNLQALKSIFKDIERENVDEIICLGDVISFGPSSKDCLDFVISKNIKMVLGNHEIYQVRYLENLNESCKRQSDIVKKELDEEELKYLKKLPLKIEIMIDGTLFIFVHYPIKNEKEKYPFYGLSLSKTINFKEVLKNVDSDYTFFGHCHDTFEMNIDSHYYYCIGSSGCTKGNMTFYTILTVDKKNVLIEKRYLTYNRKKFEKTFEKSEFKNFVDSIEKFFEREKSCGAVVYNNDNGLKFLLVKHKKGHISFPKGHMEHLETEEETAVREIKEEASIDVELYNDFRVINTYGIDFKKVKDVVYFVAKAKNMDSKADGYEIEDVMWLQYKDVLDTLTYDNDKDIFEKAYKYIKEICDKDNNL